MATGLGRKYFPPDVQICSAGTHAFEGQKVSDYAVQALKEKDIDISSHRAAEVTKDMLAEADYIFTMTNSQADALKKIYPEYSEKIKALGWWAGFGKDVPDPIGGSLDSYRSCARELERMIIAVLRKLTDRG
jgi:protein-tyrosine phosphatase